MESVKKVTSPSVSEIFSSMEYGPAPESDKVAMNWLDDHNRKFGLFINNTWHHPEGRKQYETKAPSSGKVLASTTQGTTEDVNMAVEAASEALPAWRELSGFQRAKHLYSIARHVQKHARYRITITSRSHTGLTHISQTCCCCGGSGQRKINPRDS